jgi:transcriptional regulator with XRE-family HTH domain
MSNPTYAMRVADSVRAEMARRKITQTELAESLGMTQPAISRRMSGAVPFDTEELGRIADLLGVPMSVLFGEPAA